MDKTDFDGLIDGWWKQQYTTKEMIGHLLYHVQETIGELQSHGQEINQLKQRFGSLETEIQKLKEGR